MLQETNEERRTVANNLASVFTTAANHLSITEVTFQQHCSCLGLQQRVSICIFAGCRHLQLSLNTKYKLVTNVKRLICCIKLSGYLFFLAQAYD